MDSESLRKYEIIRNKNILEELFASKSFIKVGCLKFTYIKRDDNAGNFVFFSVSKRKIPKAVDRNKLKRRMREAYRKNKYMIINNPNFYIGILYNKTMLSSYAEIVNGVQLFFTKLNNKS